MRPSATWLKECVTAALFLLVVVLFFSQIALTQERSFISWYDNTVQYYAWMTKLVSAWRGLEPPLWDFATFSGISFIGELQTGAFYPANILFAWLVGPPTQHALDLFLLVHFAFGAWGMSHFLRAHGMRRPAAFLGGLVFVLLGPVANRASGQANIFVGLVYLPWVLWLYHRGCSRSMPVWRNPELFLAGILLGVSLLAGHPQPFIHITVLLLLYAFFLHCLQGKGWSLRQVLPYSAPLAVVAVVSALVSLVQLAASIEYFSLAYRWVGLPEPVTALQVVPYEAYTQHTLSWQDLLSLFRPRDGIPDGGTLYLTLTALALSLAALAGRDKLRRFAVPVGLAAVLIALGDNTWAGLISYYIPLLNKVREPVRILVWYQFALATLAALGLQFILDRLPSRYFLPQLIVLTVTGFFLFEAHGERNRVLPRNAAAEKTASFVYMRNDVTSFLEQRSKSEQGLYRVMLNAKEIFPPNLGNVYEMKNVMGHRSSMYKPYFDYLSRDSSINGQKFDLLGARYIVGEEVSNGLPLVFSSGNVRVYESSGALPILHFQAAGNSGANFLVKQVQWRHNRVTSVVDSQTAGKVFFSQPYYPGWRALVNGAAAPIDTTDIVMNVTIPAGESTVVWDYSPWWFPAGMAAWGVVLAAFIASLIIRVGNRYVER